MISMPSLKPKVQVKLERASVLLLTKSAALVTELLTVQKKSRNALTRFSIAPTPSFLHPKVAPKKLTKATKTPKILVNVLQASRTLPKLQPPLPEISQKSFSSRQQLLNRFLLLSNRFLPA